MATILFLGLHFLALIFGVMWLAVTIPLHLFYNLMKRGQDRERAALPRPGTHVRCPDCAELVLRQARICKHCGCRLRPS